MVKKSIVLERQVVPSDTFVMREGDKGNCAYLVQSGKVSVFSEADGKRVELARLGLGQIFGEMALIFDEPRTASVVTLEDTTLIVLTRDVLNQKLMRSDPTVKAIVEMLTKRVVATNNALLKKRESIEDMVETIRIIYQNTMVNLPKDQQRVFQEAVLPKLDDFLTAMNDFTAQYSGD
ncbi:MAG: cyclic nucleotide-binding domain-containing protein [Bdellovibrionales bacterium]